MLDILTTRFKQGYRTFKYPWGPPPPLPPRFLGRPVVDKTNCLQNCKACVDICPVNAIRFDNEGVPALDTGKCLFCGECAKVCPEGSISFSKSFALAASNPGDLIVRHGDELEPVIRVRDDVPKTYGKSLHLRQVSAGGCNACEADINVLNTPAWDLSRFGIHFTASPRHADGIVVTGPVTENMASALQKTFNATPSPKIVVVVGACAISGGPFVGHDQVKNGVPSFFQPDIYIPGCPPHPLTILDGFLRFMKAVRES